MDFLIALFQNAVVQTLQTLAANWPFLAASVLISVVIKLYVDQDRVAAFLKRNQRGGVLISTAAAVGTPLCSCGTTAVVIGMMATVMPWAPIVAFMVASPLTSPQELIYSAGLFGWPFAWVFFGTSIFLGLFSGWVTSMVEKGGWLRGQARLRPAASTAGVDLRSPRRGSLSIAAPAPVKARLNSRIFLRELGTNAVRLLGFFLAFASVGYLLNGLIPADRAKPTASWRRRW